MSYSQLIVFRNGVAEFDEEYRNSHGFGPMIWEALLGKYYDLIYPPETFGFLSPRNSGLMGGWEALWKADNAGLKARPWEKATLGFTYDHALVKGSDVFALAESLERFEDAHALPNRVCHLSAIAKRLRQVGVADAVGMYGTSLSENPWVRRDNYRPYDLSKDTGHHFVEVNS